MATHNPFLTDWVKNAYSMEMSLVTGLEKQAQDIQKDSQLQKDINRHLQATRRHVELLRDSLQRMGENVSTILPANPLVSFYGQMDGDGSDVTERTGLVDFVTENFEVASYRALGALARQMGDHETARVCEQILQDEMTMVHMLDQIVPGIKSAGGEDSTAESVNIRLAHESLNAFNAHDLDRWMGLTADDYRSEAPGAAAPMNRQQNRDYLRNFMTAFPDLHFHQLRTIAQNDYVVVDWSATGTHTGQLRSPDGKNIAPTHRQAKEFGSTTFECKNGKIRRSWLYFDMGALMEQLGLTSRA